MTAALGCFDTERHGQSLFPSLFTSGTGIPLSPLFPCNPPPTDSYNPPHASMHSFLHFLRLFGFVHSGLRRRGLYTRFTAGGFHSPKHVVFTLSGMPKVHSPGSEVGGRANRSGLNATGGMRREAGPSLRRVSSGSQAWRPQIKCTDMLKVVKCELLRATNIFFCSSQ